MGGHGRRQRGQAALEFALASTLLTLMVMGVFEMAMLGYTYTVLADAAKEGVRYAVVHGSDLAAGSQSGPTCPCSAIDGSTGVVQTYAQLSFHNVSAMTVTVTYPDGTNTPSSRVRVVVAYPFQPLFGLGLPSLTVAAAAEGQVAF